VLKPEFSLHDWFKISYVETAFPHFPALECEDGFTMSIQGSASHYCSPRSEFNPAQPYSAVEVGFPSQVEPALLAFAEDASDPTGTVYGCVPVRVVEKVVASHGGPKSLKEVGCGA